MYEKIYKGEIVLGFLTWGLILNFYAVVITTGLLWAIKAKRDEKKDKAAAMAGIVALILIPYVMAIICLFFIIELAACKFDYEKYKRQNRKED